ncbi:alpha amylase C-terminal domain-containing protein [Victivallis vadensis]|uniref:1,4-alpha-glucan branching enzyme n=1 Tax=Victivallis vadensis TaxID=172901 RepID=A0A2U1ATG3_9BACT|nr:alpha amylase C-terminal domain-containing protein [Victivallis vadensis]PVY39557.1 1,4-alpha-glucan branching enzyme [Victivallis vadensis]
MKFLPLGNEPVPLNSDPWLAPFREKLRERSRRAVATVKRLTGGKSTLAEFASGHEYFGLHFRDGEWVFREWAPNAVRITLFGDFSDWRKLPEYRLNRLEHGVWELRLPAETVRHGMHYLLFMEWPGGSGDRIPAYARCVDQDKETGLFAATVWRPEQPYVFRHASPPTPAAPLIYESHVGMAQEEPKVGSFDEYREKILPKIAASGYNTIQLMAVMGHPYYGSFGYHVANFFAIASRFGTPDQFKALVDAAHGCGLRVIIDLVHSHAVKNEVEGLAKFDGTRYAYFHEGSRGEHSGWDSLCFNYAKPEVLHFLLSNCRFYLDEYRVDGFRFDGVTSMMYLHHGLGKTFTGYDDYFGGDVDEDALTYLALANRVIHEVRPDALTVAEDVSGMPGLAAPASGGGIGFDCRMAMGVTDMWFKLFDLPDQDWNMFYLFHELTNRRRDERSISYVESHDQAIVGGKTAIFRLADAAMYDAMHAGSQNLAVDRAIALHKMIRLATAAAAGHGYLNFMGNEFGHPEWIDFPREGNGWSLQHARRQWSLADEPGLRYHFLRDFDRAMLEVLNRNPEFFRRRVQTVRIDDCGKVLIFERDDCYFCFNFHPENSYFDYGFEVLPGEFETVLDSDAPEFGGFSRRAPEQRYWSRQGQSGAFITLYLPSRTALVLKRI